jgi:hypothetical protein
MGVGQALTSLPLAVWVRTVPWAYPTVETVHIIALGLLFGSIAVVDVRLLGASRAMPVSALLRHALPLTWFAFLLAVCTGSLLFLAHADDLIGNRMFAIKLCLIGVAGMNAAAFHSGPYQGVAAWDVGLPAPAVVRLLAALSLATWIGVIACGRWIAYA